MSIRMLARVNGDTQRRQWGELAPDDAHELIEGLPDLVMRGLIELLVSKNEITVSGYKLGEPRSFV